MENTKNDIENKLVNLYNSDKMCDERDYKISTITMSMQIPDCNLNLMNIGKYLEIDENIIGIKYNFGKSSILKGKYSTSIYKKSKVKNQNKINTKLFYNQVSIIVKLKNSDRSVNVKLFGNGALHLTGIKDPLDGKKVMIVLYNKLLELINKHDTILLTSDINNIYLDNNNFIYTRNEDNRTVIGYKYIDGNEVFYNIHKKDYVIDKNTGLFISTKFESKRTKILLNLDGVKVGFTRIELLQNKSKLYKNNVNVNFDYTNGFIYYDNDGKSTIIGKIIYEYTNKDKEIYTSQKDIIEYNYNCTPFLHDSIIYSIDKIEQFELFKLEYDINCINIYLKFEFELNRKRLFKELIKKSYITEYKPEKYCGVKLRYKIPRYIDSQEILGKHQENVKIGLCSCINKCTCNNITFLIFQSGNIIVTGFKSIEEIPNIIKNFNILIKEIEPIIKKKILL